MEIVCNALHVRHAHVGRQDGVERATKRMFVETSLERDARHLRDGMNAGVGAPRPVHGNGFSLDRLEGGFKKSLDGAAGCLPLPANVVGAVVLNNELVQRCQARDPGFTTGFPSAQSGQASASKVGSA